MPLQGPKNAEDRSKIHNEIAQIVRQRMANTTFAITLLGIFGIFNIQKQSFPPGTDIDPLLLGSSILLSCILFILYMYNYCLGGMLRIFTTYLKVTGESGWEQDWANYRKNRHLYFGYTKAQTIVFFALIFISTVWPCAIAKIIYSLKFGPRSLILLFVNLILGAVFLAIISILGFSRLGNIEHDFEENWRNLQQ